MTVIIRPRPPKGRFPKGNSRRAKAERAARRLWLDRARQEDAYRYGKLTRWGTGPASSVRRIDPSEWIAPEGVLLTSKSSR
jgi:hypothetical protein